MTDRDLRKLSRAELLEMLLAQSKEIENLQAQIKESQEQLAEMKKKFEDRKIALDEAGSIAQAALQLNGIFEVAQRAADQYLDNVRELTDRQEEICARKEAESQEIADRILSEANARCEKMESDTKARCDVMTARAKIEADNYWEDVSKRLEDFYNAHRGLKELLAVHTPSEQ